MGIFKERKPKKKRKGNAGETFIKLSRTLKVGGVKVSHYSRKMYVLFNDFTHGKEVNASFPLFTRLSRKFHLNFFTFVLAIALAFVVTIVFFDNSSISVQRVTVSIAGLPKELEGYTILHLSDLHGRQFGDRQASLLRNITSEQYDIALITGDMVGKDGNAQPFYDLLDGLPSSRPIYFISGDSDPGPLLETARDANGPVREFVLADWILNAEALGAHYLDAPVELSYNGGTIWLSPESLMSMNASTTLSDISALNRAQTDLVIAGDMAARAALPFTAYRETVAQMHLDATNQMEEGDLHIALSHYPPTTAYLTAAAQASKNDSYLRPVDLVLAGHYCGGVWRIPILGVLYIPSPEAERHGWMPDQSEVEGLRLLGSTSVYVSGGLGVTDRVYLPDFRLFNTPKVTLITLSSALTDDLLGLSE